MKQKFLILIILFATFLSCGNTAKNQTVSDSEISTEGIEFRKLRKLFVVGDFDGDGIIDTLFQHNYSWLTKTEIDSFPYQEDLGVLIRWFDSQESDLYLILNKSNTDTLHFGGGQIFGLYCLINIGDINSDGKDEIALVIDYLDWSNLNSCLIYTLCDNKWTLLKRFNIHEGQFEFYEDETPIDYQSIKEIRGYLEKHNGEWHYLDYLEYMAKETEEDMEMKPLKLEKCK